MTSRLIISPHLDDAVLSLGQFMATEPCVVVTVYAGIPPTGTLSDYDRSCGFDASHLAMTHRRQEDRLACAEINATAVHWDYLDGQYGEPATPHALRHDLGRLLRDTPLPFVPLGLGHPDHRFVARCARKAIIEQRPENPRNPLAILVYEELPYRVTHPEEVAAAFEELAAEGWSRGELVEPLRVGDQKHKRAAIARYRSQFPEGARDPALLCPERVWRCWI